MLLVNTQSLFYNRAQSRSVMNTKTTFAIIATVAILAAAITPTFLTEASAKITPGTPGTPPSCTNNGGNQPGGQQPTCNNDNGLTQNPGTPGTPATNPAGHAPPGQN